ncbi:3-oxoacyl-[acyl-carrier-protein] reductase [Chloroflexota bacterium]
MDLSTRVALVTGGARGIGRAISLKLAEHGAIVVVNDLDASLADKVAQEIQAEGGQAGAIAADISLSEDVKKLVETAISTYERVDILVNNAGIARDQILVRMSDEDWDKVLGINLRGAFLCTRAALRHMMKQRWGRIINIASVVGLMGNVGQGNYAAAKAGLIGLTKATAREMGARSITANALAPGYISTDMTLRLSESIKEELLKQIPLGYLGSPEDVAQAVVFLASEEARYITGQVLNVDGGMVMA